MVYAVIVSIHQPQYFPWLPYLLKIAESDIFIVLDSVDYQKNGIQNRNQIKTSQGASWLTVPVKHKLEQKIIDIEINNNVRWKKKHLSTLTQNYGKSGSFAKYFPELVSIYSQDWDYLVDLNMHILKMLLRWMKIKTKIIRSSQMSAQGSASDLILNLCLEVDATRYISGTGGRNYIDEEAFISKGIVVNYQSPVFPTMYPQNHPKVGFLKDLSVIDILLNCGQSWRDYVDFDSLK